MCSRSTNLRLTNTPQSHVFSFTIYHDVCFCWKSVISTSAGSFLRGSPARMCLYLHPQLSSFRAPTLWFINLIVATAIFNTLFWVYANFFHEKTDKTRKWPPSVIRRAKHFKCLGKYKQCQRLPTSVFGGKEREGEQVYVQSFFVFSRTSVWFTYRSSLQLIFNNMVPEEKRNLPWWVLRVATTMLLRYVMIQYNCSYNSSCGVFSSFRYCKHCFTESVSRIRAL